MKTKEIEIGVLGLWHLGSVYASSLAKLGFKVTSYDHDKKIVSDLQKATPPIEEPGLAETISKYLNKTLTFTQNPTEAIKNKQYIFITYDIPVNEKDEIDLKIFDQTAKLLEKDISQNTTVVISSQVPVGTSRKLYEKLRQKVPSVNVIYFPENLRLGTAFESFLKADRVVIGSDSSAALNQFEKDFSALKTFFLKIGLESSEMVKHMLNSYLAMLISFSGELSDISEKVGADMTEVVKAIKSDRRVSPSAPLNPGLGFAGGTLGRDLKTLRKISQKYNYKPLLINSVYAVNQNRIPLLSQKIIQTLGKTKSKNIGILGLTYKPKTNTLRRSMSLELATLLKKLGLNLKAFDPAISSTIEGFNFLKIENSVDDFFKDLDLVVLMTDWEEFRDINWPRMGGNMKTANIIDTKNWLNRAELTKTGWNYQGIGVK